jgi:hypothetical protein
LALRSGAIVSTEGGVILEGGVDFTDEDGVDTEEDDITEDEFGVDFDEDELGVGVGVIKPKSCFGPGLRCLQNEHAYDRISKLNIHVRQN